MSEAPKMKVAGVIPYMRVSNASEAADYYKAAFAATEIDRKPMPDGRLMHCHLEINGGAFMFSDAFPEHGAPLEPVQGVILHIAVFRAENLVAACRRCRSRHRRTAQDRVLGRLLRPIRDRYGITWGIVGPAEAA